MCMPCFADEFIRAIRQHAPHECGDSVDDEFEIPLAFLKLFICRREFACPLRDMVFELAGDPSLLAESECVLQSDRCLVRRDIQKKLF